MNERDVVERLRDHGIEERDLDEWVIEHSQHAASAINNQGMEAQVAFLLERGESAATILGAFGFPPNGNGTGELEGALAHCAEALRQLSKLPAFGGSPQFQAGGVGHEALQRAELVLQERARQRRTGSSGTPASPGTPSPSGTPESPSTSCSPGPPAPSGSSEPAEG